MCARDSHHLGSEDRRGSNSEPFTPLDDVLGQNPLAGFSLSTKHFGAGIAFSRLNPAPLFANVAQSVERVHGKDEVFGSIPNIGSNNNSPAP